MEVENITLYELYQLNKNKQEQYNTMLQYIRPVKLQRDLFSMKLKHVELAKHVFSKGSDEDLLKLISKVQKIDKKEVLKLTVIDFYGILNALKLQLERIIQAETNSLTPAFSNKKWEMVEGSERMAKFGIYNTLDALSKGDITKYKEIMNMSYSEIFTILLMRKTQADIQHEMSEIKNVE